MTDIAIGLPQGESFGHSAVVDHGFVSTEIDLSHNYMSYWVHDAGFGGTDMRIWKESPEGQRVTALRADPQKHGELTLYLHELYLRHVSVEDFQCSVERLIQACERRGEQRVRDALSMILRYNDY